MHTLARACRHIGRALATPILFLAACLLLTDAEKGEPVSTDLYPYD